MRRSFMNDIHHNEPGPDPDLQSGDGFRPRLVAAASYTLSSADDYRELIFACTQDTTVTAPVAGPGGTRLDVLIVRDGPGALTIVPGTGAALDVAPEAATPLRIVVPEAGASLSRTSATNWRVVGDFVRIDEKA